MTPDLVTAAAVAAILLATAYSFGRLARAQQWRIGRWGRLLLQPVKGGDCRRCRTDFVYVAPHDTPYQEDGGLCCFPLCEACWAELTPETRWPYYEQMLTRWLTAGKYYNRAMLQDDLEYFARDRFAIIAAVDAGL